MTFLTRQQQIAANRWPTATVQTEHGAIRLARISARGSMNVQAAASRVAVDAGDKERESSAALLEAVCIDDQGAPLFSDVAAARDFLDTIGGQTLTALIQAAGDLNTSKDAGDGGNAVAGPS